MSRSAKRHEENLVKLSSESEQVESVFQPRPFAAVQTKQTDLPATEPTNSDLFETYLQRRRMAHISSSFDTSQRHPPGPSAVQAKPSQTIGSTQEKPMTSEPIAQRLQALIQRITKDAWLDKAKNLMTACNAEVKARNGSGLLSKRQATILNELQHDIGAHHGISDKVRYQQARDSLDEMFTMVRSGRKDELFGD